MNLRLLASTGTILLAACQPTVGLPERTWIHSGSQHLASQKLAPGDVLHIRRWSPGSAEATNVTTPPSFVDRIPIRHVAIGTALRDHERQFVIDVITTGRTDWLKLGNFPGQRPAALLADEADVWNSIYTNSTLELTDGVLDVAVNRANVAAASEGAAGLLDPNQVALFGRAQTAATLLGGPYQLAIATSPAKRGNKQYYDEQKQLPLHDFVTVEKAGVVMERHEWPERQWTLNEWQASKICLGRSDNAVVEMTIAGLTIGSKYFELVEDARSASHAMKTAPTRYIAPNAPNKLLLPPWSLAKAELDELTAEDVQSIHWRPSNGTGQNVVPPSRCKAI
jgi:hypothetical protein